MQTISIKMKVALWFYGSKRYTNKNEVKYNNLQHAIVVDKNLNWTDLAGPGLKPTTLEGDVEQDFCCISGRTGGCEGCLKLLRLLSSPVSSWNGPDSLNLLEVNYKIIPSIMLMISKKEKKVILITIIPQSMSRFK